jgi:hypothetical protein
MAIADVTKAYVDGVTDNKFTTRTSNTTQFEFLKLFYCDSYLNTDICFLPDIKFNAGLALLLAHHYALHTDVTPTDLGGSDTGVGSVTQRSVGDLSKSFSGPPPMTSIAGMKAWLMQTTWGIQFIGLMGTFKSSPLVTGGVPVVVRL